MVGGYDMTPMPTEFHRLENLLTIQRNSYESGHVLLPWPAGEAGMPVTMTATLRERAEPYSLLVELARGKVHQVRCQLADWEMVGIVLNDTIGQQLHDLTHGFGRAALMPYTAETDTLAWNTLIQAHQLGEEITRQFTALLMESRISESGRPTTRYGACLHRRPNAIAEASYRGVFNAVRLVPSWRRIEPKEARCDWEELDQLVDWAVNSGLDTSIGPLIDLQNDSLPDWLNQWQGDLPSLAAFMSDFVETVMARYRDRVGDWLVFSGMNHHDCLGMTEDDRLRLAARVLESARQSSPDGALSIGLALPWGDYLIHEEMTYSPLVFADTLLRGGFSLAAVELELQFGDGPRCSLPRTVLDCYRLLDLFVILGVPLDLVLSCPEASSRQEIPFGWPGRTWLHDMTSLALSVPQVRSLYWQSWDELESPGQGLWHPERQTQSFSTLRELSLRWLHDK